MIFTTDSEVLNTGGWKKRIFYPEGKRFEVFLRRKMAVLSWNAKDERVAIKHLSGKKVQSSLESVAFLFILEIYYK